MILKQNTKIEIVGNVPTNTFEVPAGKNLEAVKEKIREALSVVKESGLIKLKLTNASGAEILLDVELYDVLQLYPPKYLQAQVQKLDKGIEDGWAPRFGTSPFETLKELLPGMKEVCKKLHKQYPDEWEYKNFSAPTDINTA